VTDYDIPTEIGAHTATEPRVQIIQSINHTGEVNRARYMPQKPDLIATKTVTGEVFIFDRTKHPSKPTNDICKPDITLRGHTKEGLVCCFVSLRYVSLRRATRAWRRPSVKLRNEGTRNETDDDLGD
jgi:WD40 repeat protein